MNPLRLRFIAEAWASLTGAKRRSLAIASVLAIGAAALAAGLCLRAGVAAFRDKIDSKFLPDTIVLHPALSQPRALTQADAQALAQGVSNLRAVAPVQTQLAWRVKNQKNETKARLLGTSPAWAAIARRNLDHGDFLTADDLARANDVCVLGAQTARRLFGNTPPLGQTIHAGKLALTVKGVFAPSPDPVEDDLVVVPLSLSAQAILNQPTLDRILVQVADQGRLLQTAWEIRKFLHQRHALRPNQPDDFTMREPVIISEWALLVSATRAAKLIRFAGLALAAGGFLVLILLQVGAVHRTLEFSLRRAFGARPGDLTSHVLLEAALLGLLAGLAGALGGASGARLIPGQDLVVSQVTPLALLFPVLAASLTAVVFALYPALEAAKANPLLAACSANLHHAPSPRTQPRKNSPPAPAPASEETTPPLLEAAHLLQGISLKVRAGEFVALLGPAHAGKTALFTQLAGLDLPAQGACRLNGVDLATLTDAERTRLRSQQIGLVFQHLPWIDTLNLRRNVALPSLYAAPKPNAQNPLALAGLSDHAAARPAALFRSQQQRAAIARALANDPPLLLADDPTANLDPRGALEVLTLLQQLHRGGKTILMTTRDPFAARHAQRILKINESRLTAEEPVSAPLDAAAELQARAQAQAAAASFSSTAGA